MKSLALIVVVFACLLSLAASPVRAADDFTPGESAFAKITPKQDAQVPLDLPFRDEAGNAVKLGDYFHANRPVVLTMVFFRCKGLCNYTLNGLTDTLRKLDFKPGEQFDIVTVSFDPEETPDMAAGKKESYIKSLGRPEVAPAWHFLTSNNASVAKTLGDAIGFGYRKNPTTGQYLHEAGIFICTPEGRVSRVQEGVKFDADELHDSLINASQGKISSGLFGVALACGFFHFDAATGKYAWAAIAIMRATGLTTLLALASGIGWMLYRERHKKTDLELKNSVLST